MTKKTDFFDFHCYTPKNGHKLAHNPLQSIIGPRPIGWISTVSSSGIYNLAPFSLFNLFRPTPPILGFSSGDEKDTLQNVRDTGKFVWNLVTQQLSEAMNLTSCSIAPDEDEFSLAGLTPIPSTLPGVPYVMESPVSFDCIATEIIDLKDQQGRSTGSHLVLGEAVYIRISKHLISNGVYETLAANPILRGGGTGDYYSLSAENYFRMDRHKE